MGCFESGGGRPASQEQREELREIRQELASVRESLSRPTADPTPLGLQASAAGAEAAAPEQVAELLRAALAEEEAERQAHERLLLCIGTLCDRIAAVDAALLHVA